MEIQLHTGQTINTEGIVTDAATGKELGYLVNMTPDAIIPKWWICEKEKVEHFRY